MVKPTASRRALTTQQGNDGEAAQVQAHHRLKLTPIRRGSRAVLPSHYAPASRASGRLSATPLYIQFVINLTGANNNSWLLAIMTTSISHRSGVGVKFRTRHWDSFRRSRGPGDMVPALRRCCSRDLGGRDAVHLGGSERGAKISFGGGSCCSIGSTGAGECVEDSIEMNDVVVCSKTCSSQVGGTNHGR